jgi:hypothetical protein
MIWVLWPFDHYYRPMYDQQRFFSSFDTVTKTALESARKRVEHGLSPDWCVVVEYIDSMEGELLENIMYYVTDTIELAILHR